MLGKPCRRHQPRETAVTKEASDVDDKTRGHYVSTTPTPGDGGVVAALDDEKEPAAARETGAREARAHVTDKQSPCRAFHAFLKSLITGEPAAAGVREARAQVTDKHGSERLPGNWQARTKGAFLKSRITAGPKGSAAAGKDRCKSRPRSLTFTEMRLIGTGQRGSARRRPATAPHRGYVAWCCGAIRPATPLS